MKSLFILKKSNNTDHLIGKLHKTDSGGYEIESLLNDDPQSSAYSIPVLTDPGKDGEKLRRWIRNFLPPINNKSLLNALLANFGMTEYDEWEWLKNFKPNGNNSISFSEALPPDCVRHDGMLFDTSSEPEDLPFCFPYDNFEEFEENDDWGEYDEDEDEDEEEDDDDEEESDDKPTPQMIIGGDQCDTFTVYPENIPPEQIPVRKEEFIKKHDFWQVTSMRTIQNTFAALENAMITDVVPAKSLPKLSEYMQISINKLSSTAVKDIIRKQGNLIRERKKVPVYYPNEHILLYGYLSLDLRSVAIAQKITI